MSAAVAMGQPRETRLDRVGIPYVLRWGFVGVLVFMIGHGVEASLVAPHIGAGLRNTSVVPTIVAAYGVTVIVASYLSGALSDLMGPRRVMALGSRSGWSSRAPFSTASVCGRSRW